MYKLLKINIKNNRLRIIIKTLSILTYIITIPIIIFNMTLIVKSYINPNETPSFFGYKNFIIVSRSMENTINKNDVIITKEVTQENIHQDDIIAFYQNGEIITHRIIDWVYEDGEMKYVTKGDNNIHADKEFVSYEQIEGKYLFKLSGFGVILKILQNPITILLLFIILILNCIYGYNHRKKKEIRSNKRKEYNATHNKFDHLS